MEEELSCANVLWEYMQLHHNVSEKCSLIFCLCSNDDRVATHAADLWKRNLAPYILFSGNVGALTEGRFEKTEAEHFCDVAVKQGVPREAIYLETKACNTGENIRFGKALIRERGIECDSMILVQKPYMERRCFATFMKQWPEQNEKVPKIFVSSPKFSFSEYLDENLGLSKDVVLNVMVGDFQRILEYPKKGFQIEQPVDETSKEAYEKLLKLGYNKHLIKL